MDTMKILLGATVALLFGAIVVSWQGMKQGVENASPEEIAKLNQQIAEMRAEVEAIKSQGPVVVDSGAAAEVEAMKEQLIAAQQEVQMMQAEKDAAKDVELDAKLKQDEEGLIAQKLLESQDGELKRARMIANALLMGKVKEFVEDPEYGGFITFEVVRPNEVQVGAILGIRRNTGILGRFKVSDVSPEGAIANPISGFGSVDAKPGDELIFPPQY